MNAIQTNKTYLNFIPFRILSNWSVQHYFEQESPYSDKYELVEIGCFLSRNKTSIEIKNGVEYKRVTIKTKNGGIYLRDIRFGSNIGTKKQFLIYEGQFLLSKIDARNGAFGVVPDGIDGAVITGNFWAFDVNYDLINPHYLTIVTTTPFFIRFAENASSGTTNRRYLQEILFLKQKIPLPSLEEQNRLVESYKTKIRKAEEMEQQVEVLEKEIEMFLCNKLGVVKNVETANNNDSFLNFIRYKDLDRWTMSYIFTNQIYSFKDAKYQIKPIKALLKSFDGGKTPSTSNRNYWNGKMNWFSAKDMKFLTLNSSEDKITTYAINDAGMRIYPEGTILGVFRSGILRHSFPVAILEKPATINQDLKAMTFDNRLIFNQYALFYMHIFQKFFLEHAQKTGVTVESINTDDFMGIPVVLPPLDIQNIIAQEIHTMKDKIKAIKSKSEFYRYTANREFEKEIFNYK